MSKVYRDEKWERPAWSYKNPSWGSEGTRQLEMLESIRNATESVRDELRILNRVLACPNFQAIPHTLGQIKRNTTKKRRVRP